MGKHRQLIILGALLALVTMGAYWQALGGGFVSDDRQYILSNPHVQRGLNWADVGWAFTSVYASNWHPLTWISHMVDNQVWGLDATGYHLMNVLLHIAGALLLFYLLQRMTGFVWRSVFVAALFAVHPLHVQSVAWVAERKDVLSTVFCMLAVLAYVRYVERPTARRYLLVVVLFALGLMAKPMLVSLPILLLLLDWWPLRRTASPTRLVIEKVPLALLSAASCVVTYLAQQAGGAVAVEEFPFTVRAANAAVSAVAYLWKTIVPIRLAAFYPHPGATVPPWHVIGSVAVLVGMTAFVLIQARKRTYLAVGWLWYLVTLVPVIGLLQVGVQGMADRYTYIPLIGIFTAATWGVSEACRRTLVEEPPAKHKKSRRSRPAAPTLCKQIMRFVPVLVIAGCAVGTWHQTGYWKDETSLCAHAIAVTRRNAVMYNNLGVALYEQGDTEASIVQYIKALEIAPDYADVHINLGNAYVDEGTPEAAIEEYYKAIRCNPRDPRAYNNLATVLGQMNMLDEAIRACRTAIELDPSIAEPHSNLGHALAILGRMDDAVEEYRIAIELDRDNARTHLRLAEALYAVRDYAGAWQEIEAGRKCGMEPDPEFLKELSTAMPEPDK